MITLWDKFTLIPKPLESLRQFISLLGKEGLFAFCAPSFTPSVLLKEYFQMNKTLAMRAGLKPVKTAFVDSVHGEKNWEAHCART